MSDLKFAADGATRRYDLRNSNGALDRTSMIKFLAWLGEYDLHWDGRGQCYTVVREHVGESGFNFTDYHIIGDNLEPADKDVILDPYHMCLLYQAHAHFGYEA